MKKLFSILLLGLIGLTGLNTNENRVDEIQLQPMMANKAEGIIKDFGLTHSYAQGEFELDANTFWNVYTQFTNNDEFFVSNAYNVYLGKEGHENDIYLGPNGYLSIQFASSTEYHAEYSVVKACPEGKTANMKMNKSTKDEYIETVTLKPNFYGEYKGYSYGYTIDIATDQPIYIKNISVNLVEHAKFGQMYGRHFLDVTGPLCEKGEGIDATTWKQLELLMDNLPEAATLELLETLDNPKVDGNDLEQAIYRYTYIVNKYLGLKDFMGVRNKNASVNTNMLNKDYVTIIVSVSIIAITTIAFIVLITKKKSVKRS